MIVRLVPTEHHEQRALFEWADRLAPRNPALSLLYAVPNGGYRSAATAGRLKAEGVKPGVPDICLPVARGGYHSLYIEIKRQKRGTVSPEQRKWLVALAAEGHATRVCRGWEEACQTICAYLAERLDAELAA